MIPVRILGTASVLPERAVTTGELAVALGRDPAAIERKTGIRTRHWAPPGTSLAGLGAEALRRALAAAGLEARSLRRLLFVSSTGGDVLIPATANRVAAELGLAGTCDAFDLNNACMGFVSAFDVASRSVATGLAPVAIVVVELGSRIISAEDHRPYLVFGDAAVAAILGVAREGEGVLGAAFANDGTEHSDVWMAHPLVTGASERVRFESSHQRIAEVALQALKNATRSVLEQARLSLDEVEWVLPHQPNGAMLRLITEMLGVEPTRIVPVVDRVGSVGAASIPLSLDSLLRTRTVRAGERLLMVGVGAGVSSGAVLYQAGG
ncbi:3-oxoacyl-ACP synthase III family protein [Corallococcus exercitus]|uniref:3-oxoacyl-ACP synthase III family protein n=1 Tax=Corallococcus exercitus TaxID=2316736 RepID=UPI0035D507BD